MDNFDISLDIERARHKIEYLSAQVHTLCCQLDEAKRHKDALQELERGFLASKK